MKFDVIIGNPPYQLSDGGNAASASPIYHKFVEQAKKLNPRFLTMIIPSRWFSGGKGLDKFRESMLKDDRIRVLVDYPASGEVFPGVEIKGGVCYFLWDRDNRGKCLVKSRQGQTENVLERNILENGSELFVRFNKAVTIVKKIASHNEKSFSDLVSSRKPFGFGTNFENFKEKEFENSIKIFANKKNGFVSKKEITKNNELISKYKIYITKAYGAGESYPHQILNNPLFGNKNSCCTETYLVIGPFETEADTKNVISYIKTKFFRFLVMLNKPTQDATSKVYKSVPLQDFSKPWTDEELYKKYDLTKEEIDFIESMIKPMD